MRQTYIATPFALSGDKTPIPGPVDLTGAVSYTQGWGPDYERELGVDSLAKPVSRGVSNYLFNVITTAIKAYQEQAWPEWIAPADNSGVAVAYAAGTVVTVATNAIGSRQWVSLVDNNTATPGSDSTKWQPLLYRRATSGELSAGTSTTAIATIADIKSMVTTFAPVFDGYTKTQSDLRYAQLTNNLSDLPDKATARTNLQLGTAALLNVTTSSTDTTAGRALRVADFGLGGSPAADTADPDALQFSCFFRAFNSAKMPTVAAYSGIHIQREPGNARAAQIIWSDAPFEQYSRARSASGVWSAWSKPYSNTNTSSFIQALLDDPDDATARATLGIVEPLGRNQTWQNVTGARAANTNYTNTTGRTIAVVFTAASGAITDYFIDSQPVARSNVPAGGTPVTTLIVPAGSTYSIGGGFYLWWELR